MPRKSYNSIQGVLSSFPILVLLYTELSCKNGIPNVSPMLKERQGGKIRGVSQWRGIQYCRLKKPMWNNYNENSEYF